MQAIDYVVRTGQGRVLRGELSGSNENLVLTTAGKSDISLNISRDDVDDYTRIGNDLVIKLEDGREITIEGIFNGNGGQTSRLYFSEGGRIEEITFTESWGRTNQAHVSSNADNVDGLVFNEGSGLSSSSASANAGGSVSASGGGSASTSYGAGFEGRTVTTWELNDGAVWGGLGGLLGLGLLAGGGGGSAAQARVTDEIRITSVAGGADSIVNGAEMAAGPSISGVTEPNLQVTVTVQGVSVVTTSDANGNWTAVFNPAELDQGEYVANVSATAVGESGSTLTTAATMNVDTTTAVAINSSTIEGDGIVVATEAGDGVLLTGTGEAGSTVNVTFQGTSQTTVVTDNGTWSVNFSPASVEGINDQAVAVTADITDAVGNTASSTQTIRVDTVIDVDFNAVQMGDNIINETEAGQPVTFTGTTNPGASVIVDLNGNLHDATVAPDGSWTVTYQPHELPAGTTGITLIATATDALGNVANTSHVVQLDDSGFVDILDNIIEIDNIVNNVESQDGVVVTGTTFPGSTVVVEFGSYTGEAVVDANGNWTIDIPASEIAAGEYTVNINATATTASGNVSTDSRTLNVDTLVNTLSADLVAGDDVINAAEYNNGVVVTGTVEAGSTVLVTIHDTQRTATVDANGNWTVTFEAGAFPEADYTTTMVVDVTDGAGNTDTHTRSILIDTVGSSLTLNPIPLGDDDIINQQEANAGLTISGVSEPNVEITVEFNGTTHTVMTDPDGNWSITLGPDDIGTGNGVIPLILTTVDGSGNVTTMTQPINLDTEVSNVTFPSSEIAIDGVVNSTEAGQELEINGTAEIGSTVVVTIAGVNYQVPVDANGNWVLTLDADTFAPGEYDVLVTAQITDGAGNSISQTTTVVVDTEVSNFAVTSTSMDGQTVLNSFVAQTGINLSGTVESGSTVEVTFEGTTKTATVNSNGTWTVSFSGDEVRIGEYTTDAQIVATDAAGNSSTLTSTFVVDTAIPDAPELTAITEGTEGIRSIALPFSTDSFEISSMSEDGSTSTPISTSVLHDTFRNELLFNFASDVPDGTDLMVQLNDDAGNSSSTLFILDDNAEVDMGAAGLENFDVGAVDLAFAQDSSLTITAEQLEDLSEFSDNLLIRGEEGDTVTAIGAVRTSETEVIGGQTYDIYTLGDNGAYMLIDQDIDVLT